MESVFDNRAPGRKCHLYIQNIAPQQGGAAHMGIKDLSDFVLPVQKLKEGDETKKVQQCRKIPSNFVTYHGFYPHKKGAPSQLKLDFGQVAPDCEVIRFRMTALRFLPKRIICFRSVASITGSSKTYEVFEV